MIKIANNNVKIDTLNNTLLFHIGKKVELLYYGKRINDELDYSFFKYNCGERLFSSADDIDATPSILSFVGDGNNRESLLHIVEESGFASFRFEIDKFYSVKNINFNDGLPHSKNAEEYFVIEYKESKGIIRLMQYFGIFNNSDVISTGIKVINEGDTSIFIKRIFSIQIDLPDDDFVLTTLRGKSGGESHETEVQLNYGVYSSSSFMGLSSNVVNPFISLNCKKQDGFAISTNLLYSGNHKEIVEKTKLSGLRILSGINDYLLDYKLIKGESFSTPEGIFVYGKDDYETSFKMRDFVNNHIVNSSFKNVERPIVINSWESLGFNFNFNKLYEICDCAIDCGIEMLVIDDGWFGNRNNDKSSLGDWFYNEKKIGCRLSDVAKVVKSKNLKLGIWFEPEMVSEESELYNKHPEYAMVEDGVVPIRIRNQIVLDLTLEEVRNYIIDCISYVIEDCNVDYVKWDCNRGFTEILRSGSYFYDYVISLYRILDILTKKYPKVLFEGCASGGNRFDLGILYFMPQIWASDNTDARERLFIQEGLLNAYPQSCISAHVPSKKNMHSFNIYSMFSRFAVSSIAILGYELDLTKLSKDELEEIKKYNAFYKQYRNIIQFGEIYVIEKVKDSGRSIISFVDKDKNNCVIVVSTTILDFCKVPRNIKVKGLDSNALYSIKTFLHKDRIDENIKVSGSTLENCGFNIGNISVVSDLVYDMGIVSSEIIILSRVVGEK